MWASHFIDYEQPATWLNSGGAGTMGYAVPAAMGAKAGMPDRTVWAIDGDGCFQMTNQELTTCALNNIPIKVAIINNGALGMVRQWQTLFYNQRYSNTVLHSGTDTDGAPTKGTRVPDFVKLSEAMGCYAIRCEDPADLDKVIEEANSINDRPVVIDFIVHEDAMVWPMVAMRHLQRRGRGRPWRPPRLRRQRRRLRDRERTTPMSEKHTLSVLVENKPGVLARITALFSRRGFNIDSLAVGTTEHPDISRITIVVNVEGLPLEQVTKQLNKLVNVLKIVELEPAAAIQRELVLVKVRADSETRSQIVEIVQLFRAKTVDVSPEAVTIEATGGADKLEAMLKMLEQYGIKELVQSGTIAIGRGARSITDRSLRALDRSA